MPSSRNSSLSRSNMRSKASSEGQFRYGSKTRRSRSLVTKVREASRQITRLTRRSDLLAAMMRAFPPRPVSVRPTLPVFRTGFARTCATVGRVIAWREGRVTALGRAWPGARELTARVGEADLRVLAYPHLVGEPRIGDRILLNVNAQALGLRHRRLRAGRRPPGPPAAGPPAGPRPPGEGALHPAADDRPRRRRAGFAAPRSAERCRLPRRHARRRRRPALRPPRDLRRDPARPPRNARRVRDERRRRTPPLVLPHRRGSARGRVAVRLGHRRPGVRRRPRGRHRAHRPARREADPRRRGRDREPGPRKPGHAAPSGASPASPAERR